MVWAAALTLAAATASAPSGGPYILIVETKDGYQFAHFSNARNCMTARQVIVDQRDKYAQEWERRGYKLATEALFWSVCVPG